MKNKVGSPAFFKCAKELEKRVDAYFKNPDTRTVSIGGNPVEVPCLTVTGLAISLGFASRQSFYDQEKNDKFSYIIKRARLFIEHQYEKQLYQNNVTGAIFALKNMGWKDKSETDITTLGGTLSNNFNIHPVMTKGRTSEAALD